MSSEQEIVQGERFKFGNNWARFLRLLNKDRIKQAEDSLKKMLATESLAGKRFLDIGSGSGLFSLAARRLGAEVYSFDYDSQSVACTQELKDRFFPGDSHWIVEKGSALDRDYLASLGSFDVVYSWGVLHHTGAMWTGIEHAIQRLAPGGLFLISLYNDQGWKSRLWWFIKWFYNKLPWPLNAAYCSTLGVTMRALNILKYTLKLHPMVAIKPLFARKRYRGMSALRDLTDWMGGFPYEFVKYDVLVEYMRSRGMELVRGSAATSLGCHEFVFQAAH